MCCCGVAQAFLERLIEAALLDQGADRLTNDVGDALPLDVRDRSHLVRHPRFQSKQHVLRRKHDGILISRYPDVKENLPGRLRSRFLFSPARTGNATVAVVAKRNSPLWLAFLGALDDLGLSHNVSRPASDASRDAVGLIGGVSVVIDMRATIGLNDVTAFTPADSTARHVVVAERISKDAQAWLVEHDVSFYDRRGRLRLWSPPLLIDALLATQSSGQGPHRALRLGVPSTLDVALACLDGLAGAGVRRVAAGIDRAPGTVSKALAQLRAAHLIDKDNAVVGTELFEEVADIWRPVRVPLAHLPPTDGSVVSRLRLGTSVNDEVGWVTADAHAAQAWGAPVVRDAAAPPDFYVPDEQVLGMARTLLGTSTYEQRACTVAVAPSPLVCHRRIDRRTANDRWFSPMCAVAALDLAIDPARGREILDLWARSLPDGATHVW